MSMQTYRFRLFIAAMAVHLCLAAPLVRADISVLERFIGHWDIHAEILRPEPLKTSYSETYEWVLDGKFVRGKTARKADGNQDIIFGTYDKQTDGFPFWIFSSSGSYLYLAPAIWHPRELTMEWKNPSGWDVNYHSSCHFPDRDNRSCGLIMKDWKGKVMLEMKWRAVRRTD